jgi:hypothetical protein
VLQVTVELIWTVVPALTDSIFTGVAFPQGPVQAPGEEPVQATVAGFQSWQGSTGLTTVELNITLIPIWHVQVVPSHCVMKVVRYLPGFMGLNEALKPVPFQGPEEPDKSLISHL